MAVGQCFCHIWKTAYIIFASVQTFIHIFKYIHSYMKIYYFAFRFIFTSKIIHPIIFYFHILWTQFGLFLIHMIPTKSEISLPYNEYNIFVYFNIINYTLHESVHIHLILLIWFRHIGSFAIWWWLHCKDRGLLRFMAECKYRLI